MPYSLQGELQATFIFQQVLLNWTKGMEFKGKPTEGVLFKHRLKVPIMRKCLSLPCVNDRSDVSIPFTSPGEVVNTET